MNEVNLEAKILEALENPKVYDFAIDRQGKKVLADFFAGADHCTAWEI